MDRSLAWLGRRIARHREAIGLTQAQLAELVEVHQETISRIENGRRVPSLITIDRIARSLEIELHELFKGTVPGSSRDRALDRIHLFASRLAPREIELVIEVGAAILKHTRMGPIDH